MGVKGLMKKKETTSAEEFINRGGEVASDKLESKNEWSNYTLRIRKDLSAQIDEALEQRVGLSKAAWILEAIQEKLRKE